LDTLPEHLPPVQLPAGAKPTHVAAGSDFTCVVLDHKSLICWGANGYGQLGYGNRDTYGDSEATAPAANITVSLPDEGPIKQLQVVRDVVCVLFEVGTVSCWGRGQWGAHGGNTMDNLRASPETMLSANGTVQFYQDRKMVSLAGTVDGTHICAIQEGLTAMCWGRGFYHALGRSSKDNVGDSPSRSVASYPQVPLPYNFTQVAAGTQHTCGLTVQGKVYCWGEGYFGALGYGSYADVIAESLDPKVDAVQFPGGQNATAIYAGGYSTCAVLESNDLHCWGRNVYYELGYDHNQMVGNSAPPMHTVASTPPVPLPSAAAIKEVHKGDGATCVLFVDNTLTCWGESHLKLGWGIGKHTAPVEMPLYAIPTPPPVPVASPFGPFVRTGIIIGDGPPSHGGGSSSEDSDDMPGSDTQGSATGGPAGGNDNENAGGGQTGGGSTGGGQTGGGSTGGGQTGGGQTGGGQTGGGQTGGGSTGGGQTGGGQTGGGQTGGGQTGGGQTGGGQTGGGQTGGGSEAGETVGGAAGASGGVATEGTASLAGGVVAGIVVAAVLVLAVAGLAVYKLVLVPAAAAKAAAAAAAAAGKGGAGTAAVATMTNPLSRAAAAKA